MGVQLLSIEGSQVKIEVTIDLSRSMLTSEETIQKSWLCCKNAYQQVLK